MRTSILILVFITVSFAGYAQNNSEASTDTYSITDSTVFDFCEVMPSIKTKEYKTFEDYLLHNLIYPEAAKKEKVSGQVYVSFIIEKDGSVSTIKIVKSLHPACDQEAIRVISRCPKWNPGMQNGKIVRVRKINKFVFN